MSAISNCHPRWTKRAVLEGIGRDLLRLYRVSENFTNLLLPSIITTTNRARYYSFYPWGMRDGFECLEGNDDTSDFLEEFRKREAAFAIASKIGKVTDLSIDGIDEVSRKLGEVSDDESVATLFKVLPANKKHILQRNGSKRN
jgi:hypothetical protein